MRKNLREEMPGVATFIDSMRKTFGADAINQQIRAGMNGQPTFYAKENGHEIGTKWIKESRDAKDQVDRRKIADVG